MPIRDSIAEGSNNEALVQIADGENEDLNKAGVTSANRLKVDAVVGDDDDADPYPLIYKAANLLNGASKDMDVDGDPTPIDFEWAPSGSEIWRLERINILIQDPGSMDVGDFGAIGGGLDNGVQVILDLNGTEYEICNMLDNGDVDKFFENDNSQSGRGDASGWLDEEDTFSGKMVFAKPPILKGANGDKVIFRIRDDIDGLSFFESSVFVRRVV